MRRFSPNPEATKEANFTDHRSYVSSRQHPGSDHACMYLKGDDVAQARRRVFERERGRCWKCGAYYGWEFGHLRHLHGGNGEERCWCDENLGWGCPKCHMAEHGRVPRWVEK
jgi:5-methylcytosine-specific restriction endonuclease McrA